MKSVNRKSTVKRKVTAKMYRDTSRDKSIVALGGGNAEYLYKLEREITPGEKNSVSEAVELVGGGGMNFSSRLIAAGFETYPILAIGGDPPGQKIQQELRALAEKAKLSRNLQDFIRSPDFLIMGLNTAFAVLIVLAAKRTILNYRASGNAPVFQRHMFKRLKYVSKLTRTNPTVIHISHLPNFALAEPVHAEIGNDIIKEVIRTHSGKCIITFNPGSSQIQHGIRYWEKELRTTTILQLNMSEAKQIFSIDGLSTSLVDMINWFKERAISVIITLDRFGAVGSHKAGKDGIIFAWPIELLESEMVDPTGAGDAFAAGVISEICMRPNFEFQDFFAAINTGRYWSAYACTTLGGAGNCPNASTISKFREKFERESLNPIEVISQKNAERELKLINKAFE